MRQHVTAILDRIEGAHGSDERGARHPDPACRRRIHIEYEEKIGRSVVGVAAFALGTAGGGNDNCLNFSGDLPHTKALVDSCRGYIRRLPQNQGVACLDFVA